MFPSDVSSARAGNSSLVVSCCGFRNRLYWMAAPVWPTKAARVPKKKRHMLQFIRASDPPEQLHVIGLLNPTSVSAQMHARYRQTRPAATRYVWYRICQLGIYDVK